MADLYIVRHGITEWNVDQRIQGRQNSNLTAEGIHQATQLSEKLSSVPFSTCYCSPMPRAVHTAHLLIGERSIPFIVSPLLAEMNLGKWEGLTISDFKKNDSDAFDAFSKRADLFVPDETGESFEHVIHRASLFLNSFEHLTEKDPPILCVTHCILIQALNMICEDRPLSTLRSPDRVEQCGIFIFRWDNNKKTWTIVKKNAR